MTQSSATPGTGFEPTRRDLNKAVLWVAVGMLALLAVLLGIAYFVYREGPPVSDPALDPTMQELPPAPAEPVP